LIAIFDHSFKPHAIDHAASCVAWGLAAWVPSQRSRSLSAPAWSKAVVGLKPDSREIAEAMMRETSGT